MRLDHIAYRVKDRSETADFFKSCFGYEIGEEFLLEFDDGTTAECIAMAPPENRPKDTGDWDILLADCLDGVVPEDGDDYNSYHSPPEIFVSDGPKGSIVGDWVKERGGVGGFHHMAYQVDNVDLVMKEWQNKKYVEFCSDKPLVCEETHLVQVFTKPSKLTGVIYELIKRGENNKGFCEKNVKALMESTRDE